MKIESLSLFDFFGFKPYFYLNGNKYYTTLFGFIISIISVLSMLGLTVYFILDMFDTNNFSIVISNIQTQSLPSFNWTNDVFYFGMALEDPITLDYYIDESIYSLKAIYHKGVRDDAGIFHWEHIDVELEPCQISKYPKHYQHFLQDTVRNMYCIKNLSYIVEGTYIYDVYAYIEFSFSQCKNTTDNYNKCKPQDVINRYINGTYFGMQFT